MDAYALQRHSLGDEQLAEPAQEIVARWREAPGAQQPVDRRHGGFGNGVHAAPIIEAAPLGVKSASRLCARRKARDILGLKPALP